VFVGSIDGRAARDELADDGVPGAPCGVVQGRGVLWRVEPGIAFGPERSGGDAEVEQDAEAFKVGGACKSGEERAADL